MYGSLIPTSVTGNVGLSVAVSTLSILQPNRTITSTGEKVRVYATCKQLTVATKQMTVDGVEMVFQMAPDTEAPSEMLLYLPQFRILHLADLVMHTQHNLVTLRGAKARNPATWAKAIDDALTMFGGCTLFMH
jgi:alkyl sulfatase BDS1-like metallo-beta-lactamase superfamily hydrolase